MFSLVRFPLLKDDERPLKILSTKQKEAIKNYRHEIKMWKIKHREIPCLCWKDLNDVVISEKDMHWLSVEFVLCLHCWLIRIKKIPDAAHLQYFYEKYYRDIWEWSTIVRDRYFKNEFKKWKGYIKLLHEQNIHISKPSYVFELWCGAWWCLSAFKEKGFEVAWCDYGLEYVEYWRKKWLNLYQWTIDSVDDESVDLFLLLEVLEHLDEPIVFLRAIINKIKPWKFLLIWLPATRNFIKVRWVQFFQYVHLYSYHIEFLKELFHEMWLTMLYINNRSDIILQKPKNRTNKENLNIDVSKLADEAWELSIWLKKYYFISCMPIVLLFKLKFDRLVVIYRKMQGFVKN